MNPSVDEITCDDDVIQEVNADLLEIRSKICDLFLLVFSFLVIPALTASLYRIISIGWQPVMILHIIVCILLWFIVIFRKQIPYEFRAGYIIFIFLSVGVGGIIQFGLISGGGVFLIISVPLAALFLGAKATAYTIILAMSSIAVVGFFTVSGKLEPSIDLIIYNSALSSWVVLFLASFLLAASLAGTIFSFNRKLISSIQVSKINEKKLIQHQINLEEIIEEKTLKLKQSNQELERFAQISAHDINSPLCNISGHAQLLQTLYSNKLDDRANSSLVEIINGVNYVSSILKDQLTSSKIDTENNVLATIDMNIVLKNAKKQLLAEIEESHAVFTQDELPMVRIDATKMTRVFQNLISNCIKYRNKKNVLKVHIGCKDNDNCWVFSVSDNGIGIDASHKDKVFDMYHQVSDEKTTSMGIGLASCKKIIESYNGKIWFESVPGLNCTIYFSLNKTL